MKTLFYTVAILVLFCLTSCSTYVYYNSTWKNSYIDWQDSSFVDLETFECYYRVIHRHSDRLEKTVPEGIDADTNQNIHITDLQYIFINRKTQRFLMISYMPVHERRFTKKDPNARDDIKGKDSTDRSFYRPKTNFLDAVKRVYKSEIHLNGVRQIQYGKIENNELCFEFNACGNKEHHRKDRCVMFDQKDSKKIVLKQIRYLGKKSINDEPIQFSEIFEEAYHTYYQMDKVNLFLNTGNDNSEKITLKPQIYIAKVNGKRKPKNLVLFEYETARPSPGGNVVFPILFFEQKLDRLKFKNPD